MKGTLRWLRTAAAVSLVSLAIAAPARADLVTDWNLQTFAAGGAQQQRTLAMVHLAMFDAINAIQPRYKAYLALPAPPAGASAEAAAASAAHGVLVRLFPAQAAALQAALNASLATIPDGQSETDGVAYGDLVAAALFNARLTDNILAPGPLYVSTGEPGVYQLTTPGPPQPVNSGARNWVPFALTSASQFRPGPPPALTSIRYARDVNETREWGGTVSAFRSAHDDETARWMTETAGPALNRAARAEVVLDGRGLLAHARLFALLNVAIADAATAVFDAKYTYLFWRPVTAIRNADVDGNDRTALDASWSSFITTPPHPEYPAAHGTVTTAGTRILERYFGQHYAFNATSSGVPGVTRTYESFEAFAEDAGYARIVGGMHYRNSVDVGRRQGKSVGNWVMGNILQPLDEEN
ncbi:MAG TPA: vanadium-dependent haloperoxidase [Vicinamibacterales bacterium]|nr:vanadium-dependent haloperoxidase [Vicinamibacterales bacterium]